MNNTVIISLSNLKKSYCGKEVLSIDSLSIQKRCVTGIIGPSGSGKSTLLRILNQLETPTAGTVSYFGRPVPASGIDRLTLRRQMTMVFQKPALLDMSVYDNIAFGLRARRTPETEVRRRVDSALAQIQMESQGRQNAKTLSGGEAQRVAFARALVLEPAILFLDEPTANLDPANVELLEGLITGLNKRCGTTVIMVTHNLFQAQRLTTEAVFLYQGKLIEAGNSVQLLQAPAREETRAFVLGKMIY